MENPFEQIINRIDSLREENKELRHLLMVGGPEEKPIKISEASEFIGMPESTIREHIRNNGLPFHKPGKELIFYRSELNNWVRRRANGLRKVS